MPNHKQIEITHAAPEQDESKEQRSPSPSQVAAVVEAAYILEAVRK
jgi:hypothetical protein